MTTSWYRIQSAGRNVADLLTSEQTSEAWGGSDDDTRSGVSVCDSLESLAAYLVTAGIPFGAGEWVVVELTGELADDEPLDAGEYLIVPDSIVSVRPMGDEMFDLIDAAYDALND